MGDPKEDQAVRAGGGVCQKHVGMGLLEQTPTDSMPTLRADHLGTLEARSANEHWWEIMTLHGSTGLEGVPNAFQNTRLCAEKYIFSGRCSSKERFIIHNRQTFMLCSLDLP